MTYRILIVDDEHDCIDLFLQVLGEAHEVRGTCDGLEALEQVRAFQPDLVITDLSIPGLSGVELARRIRRDGISGATKIMAFTGASHLPDEELALFDRFLTKPMSIRRLEREVEELLAAHAVAT